MFPRCGNIGEIGRISRIFKAERLTEALEIFCLQQSAVFQSSGKTVAKNGRFSTLKKVWGFPSADFQRSGASCKPRILYSVSGADGRARLSGVGRREIASLSEIGKWAVPGAVREKGEIAGRVFHSLLKVFGKRKGERGKEKSPFSKGFSPSPASSHPSSFHVFLTGS